MNNLIIRKAIPLDEIQILYLLDNFHRRDYFMTKGHIRRCLIGSQTKNQKQMNVSVAEIENKIIGILINTRDGWLNTIFIHPEFRKKGIGSALLNFDRPAFVRVKINESSGNPVKFYLNNDYKFFSKTKKIHIDIYKDSKHPQKELFEAR